MKSSAVTWKAASNLGMWGTICRTTQSCLPYAIICHRCLLVLRNWGKRGAQPFHCAICEACGCPPIFCASFSRNCASAVPYFNSDM